jgi:hypothetical protein
MHPSYPQQQPYAHPRYPASPRYYTGHDVLHEVEIESQESRQEISMLSEPVVPPLEGFPDVREFDQLMKK